jgi:hypothetical protein
VDLRGGPAINDQPPVIVFINIDQHVHAGPNDNEYLVHDGAPDHEHALYDGAPNDHYGAAVYPDRDPDG